MRPGGPPVSRIVYELIHDEGLTQCCAIDPIHSNGKLVNDGLDWFWPTFHDVRSAVRVVVPGGREVGTEVICPRLRQAYAETARVCTPDAIEVADRWLQWHSAAEAAEKIVAAQHRCLRSALEPEPGVIRETDEQLRRVTEEMIAAHRRTQSSSPHRASAPRICAPQGCRVSMSAIRRELGLALATPSLVLPRRQCFGLSRHSKSLAHQTLG